MLVIGHRGAAGLAKENTLEALQAGYDAGADILEFDVHMTSDGVLVLAHDRNLRRTHKTGASIGNSTLAQLKEIGDKTNIPVATLEEVLDIFFGRIILNMELKPRGLATPMLKLLKRKYIKKATDWDLVVFSSFSVKNLKEIRQQSKRANLWLLHYRNPFIFLAYTRRLQLNGVGFHRLYINNFALEIAKKTGLFSYAYTVNRAHAAYLLAQKGVDAVVSNHPSTILSEIERRAKKADPVTS